MSIKIVSANTIKINLKVKLFFSKSSLFIHFRQFNWNGSALVFPGQSQFSFHSWISFSESQSSIAQDIKGIIWECLFDQWLCIAFFRPSCLASDLDISKFLEHLPGRSSKLVCLALYIFFSVFVHEALGLRFLLGFFGA